MAAPTNSDPPATTSLIDFARQRCQYGHRRWKGAERSDETAHIRTLLVLPSAGAPACVPAAHILRAFPLAETRLASLGAEKTEYLCTAAAQWSYEGRLVLAHHIRFRSPATVIREYVRRSLPHILLELSLPQYSPSLSSSSETPERNVHDRCDRTG